MLTVTSIITTTKQQMTQVFLTITIISVVIVISTRARSSYFGDKVGSTDTQSTNNTNNNDDDTTTGNREEDNNTRRHTTRECLKSNNDPNHRTSTNNDREDDVSRQWVGDEDDDEDDSATTSASVTPGVRLPSHIERDIYKEQRRKVMTPLLTMKKPLYDNIILIDPDGNTLSAISLKRAKRYVAKNLAHWILPPAPQSPPSVSFDSSSTFESDTTARKSAFQSTTPVTLQLKFYTKITNPIPNTNYSNNNTNNRQQSSSTGENAISVQKSDKNSNPTFDRIQFNQSLKVNQCVVCGSQSKGYMRHYIVPYMYRTKFPRQYKVHLAHDIVLLCPMCSLYCKQITHRFYTDDIEYPLRKQYWTKKLKKGSTDILLSILNSIQMNENDQYRSEQNDLLHYLIDISTKAELVNPSKQKVRTAALALLRRKHQLPPDRVIEYANIIESYYHRTNTNDRNTNITNNTAEAPPIVTNDKDDIMLQKATVTPLYLTKGYLQQLSVLKFQDPNPLYHSGVDLVIDSLLSPNDSCKPEITSTTYNCSTMNERIDNFVKMFRRHFIDTMNPQYLPLGWSIDAPTVCYDDDRT